MNEGVEAFYRDKLYSELNYKNIPEEIMNKYEFVECIAETLNSSTYVVIHKALKTRFLIKISENTGQSMEYAMLKELNHESIPCVFDMYLNGRQTLVIEEYFHGKTLRRIMDEEDEISENKVLDILLGICDVLQYLHSHEPPIIHKDIKPENIIITDDNKIKLIDFGAARRFNKCRKKDTVLLGTEGYAAPEQYGFKQTDCRTDIYGLGMLMDEVITKLNCNINKKYMCIINKCKELDPENRYQSIKEIITDIMDKRKHFFQRKNTMTVMVSVMLLVFAGMWAVNYMHNNKQDIYFFESEAVARAVSTQSGKPIDEITYEDLKQITGISIWGEKILDKEDILAWASAPGNYVSIYTINGTEYINRGDISNLADFQHMPNLKTLQLVKQEIVDISPLKELNIVHLYLSDNKIKDISPLSDMSSLYTLEIGGNPVSDFQILTRLNYLGELDISCTKCNDMGFVSSIHSLKMLKVKNLGIKNIEFVSDLYNMECLDLQYNNIEDISPLVNLAKLEYLNVSNNPISDVSLINHMESMRFVVIKDSRVDPDTIDERIEIRQD